MGIKSRDNFAPSNKLTENRFNGIFKNDPESHYLAAFEPCFKPVAMAAGVSVDEVRDWVRGRCAALFGDCS